MYNVLIIDIFLLKSTTSIISVLVLFCNREKFQIDLN